MDKDLKQTNHTKLYSRSSKKMVALSFVAAVQISGCVSGRWQGFRDSSCNIDILSLSEGSPEFNRLQAKTSATVAKHFAQPNAELAQKNALRNAIEKGDLKSVQLLLLNDKDIDLNAVGNGLTSLVWALKCKHEKLFYLLLADQRIDITTPDPKSGLTPLHLTIQRRFNPGVMWLVKNLPSEALYVKDSKGRTPLHLAIKHLPKDVLGLLIDKLSLKDLCEPDGKGRTPLQLAAGLKRKNAFKLLFDRIVYLDKGKGKGKGKAIAALFTTYEEYSVFACGYLPKNKLLSGVSFTQGSAMFKFILETIPDCLDTKKLVTIVEEIDDLQDSCIITKKNGAKLRCMVENYINKQRYGNNAASIRQDVAQERNRAYRERHTSVSRKHIFNSGKKTRFFG